MGNSIYNQVIKAFDAQIDKECSKNDPTRDAIAKLCKACFLIAAVDPDTYSSSDVTALIAECSRHDYACWIDDAKSVLANADLSFLSDHEECKMKFEVAFDMASAWMLQLCRLRNGATLPALTDEVIEHQKQMTR